MQKFHCGPGCVFYHWSGPCVEISAQAYVKHGPVALTMPDQAPLTARFDLKQPGPVPVEPCILSLICNS